MKKMSWQMIENEFGSPITSEEHSELVRIQNKFNIWQVCSDGLLIEFNAGLSRHKDVKVAQAKNH
jgi:hypothetical protein